MNDMPRNSRRITLNGRPAWIGFKSRYHAENDCILHCDGKQGRVRYLDSGERLSCSAEFTQAEASEAIGQYLAAEEADYQEWRLRNADLLTYPTRTQATEGR